MRLSRMRHYGCDSNLRNVERVYVVFDAAVFFDALLGSLKTVTAAESFSPTPTLQKPCSHSSTL